MTDFASHNVMLPDGTCTAPQFPLVADSAICRAALRELAQFADPAKVTVADLGSLEGGYAAALAAQGFDVTGFEARRENHENAVWLQEQLGLPNLHFVCGDVRETLPGRQFDVVLCSGLLYHLDAPVAFLRAVGHAARLMLILNTHVSMTDGHPESSHWTGSGCDPAGSSVHEGRRGHWYRESRSRWDSFGNASSFWLTPDDLVKTLKEDAGFSAVREIEDWRELGLTGRHVPGGAGIHYPDRRMWGAVK